MRKMNPLILGLILCASMALADDATHITPTESQRQWSISGGMNRYTESLMQLSGPEVGLHARWSGLEHLPRWQLEGDVLLGLPARSAVNIPGLNAEVMEQLKPHLQLAEILGQLLSQLADGGGELLGLDTQLPEGAGALQGAGRA